MQTVFCVRNMTSRLTAAKNCLLSGIQVLFTFSSKIQNLTARDTANVNDASPLSARPRWPLSPSQIQISLKLPAFREEFSSTTQPPANFKSTRMRETGGGLVVEGGMRRRGGLWGTQQGHLPAAIWWLRWFYTVVFVCLFRLGFLPESAAGQSCVIIYLPPTSLLFHSSLRHLSLSVSVSHCFCCYPRNLLAVVIVTDGQRWLKLGMGSLLLLITHTHLNQWFDSWTFSPPAVCPCVCSHVHGQTID